MKPAADENNLVSACHIISGMALTTCTRTHGHTSQVDNALTVVFLMSYRAGITCPR